MVSAEPALELAAGEIHSHPDARQSGVLPGAVLDAGGLQNPFTHGHDQPVLLGDRE